jgi:chromosome segregation ATPase
VGLLGWIKERFAKPKPVDDDPVKAYDRRLDTLTARAADLRRSAATLLAARGEVDRALKAAQAGEEQARARLAQAQGRPDVVKVLEGDLALAQDRQKPLSDERERIDAEAKNLAETVGKVESEAEALRRERDAVAARLAASRSMTEASSRVLSDNFSEMTALERAREEVERAHALADLAREDLKAAKKR